MAATDHQMNANSSPATVLAALLWATLWYPGVAHAESVPVRHVEGTIHGFLVLRTADGKPIAAGDLTQAVRGNQLESNLSFHFKDGSIDDETTIYSQHPTFRLLSDKHLQKGRSFPHPMEIVIDAIKGDVTVRSWDGDKEKVEQEHWDLPPDLANGLLLTLLKNIPSDTAETKVSYLAATPKPRLVKLAIKPEGTETFFVAGTPHPATRYDLKVELGGLTGFIAPIVGKQPDDIHMWVLGGKAPAFIRMEGPLYQGGPIWTIELTSPAWQRSKTSGIKRTTPAVPHGPASASRK